MRELPLDLSSWLASGRPTQKKFWDRGKYSPVPRRPRSLEDVEEELSVVDVDLVGRVGVEPTAR